MDEEPGENLEEGATGESLSVSMYEQGLPLSSTVRATLTRFFPGAVLSTVVGATLSGAAILSIGNLLTELSVAGVLSLGFAAGVELMRRHLYPDAGVEGRRSFVAGLVAPLAAYIAGVLGAPIVARSVFGFLFLPALIIAILMFFAWLTPTPEEMRSEKYRLLPNETPQ